MKTQTEIKDFIDTSFRLDRQWFIEAIAKGYRDSAIGEYYGKAMNDLTYGKWLGIYNSDWCHDRTEELINIYVYRKESKFYKESEGE